MLVQQKKIFYAGIILSLLLSVFLFAGTYLSGKAEFFLALNGNAGPVADQVFKIATLLGDGIVWVIVALIVLVYRRKYFPLIVAAILISTLLTQGTKHFIFPGEPRPTYGLIERQQIHTVPGVELHTVDSFPSGHTGTAFTIFLLGCLLIRKWWIVPVGFFYAAMVGYSRIYLAQHFPVDVGAGILTGVLTVIFSAAIQKRWAPLP